MLKRGNRLQTRLSWHRLVLWNRRVFNLLPATRSAHGGILPFINHGVDIGHHACPHPTVTSRSYLCANPALLPQSSQSEVSKRMTTCPRPSLWAALFCFYNNDLSCIRCAQCFPPLYSCKTKTMTVFLEEWNGFTCSQIPLSLLCGIPIYCHLMAVCLHCTDLHNYTSVPVVHWHNPLSTELDNGTKPASKKKKMQVFIGVRTGLTFQVMFSFICLKKVWGEMFLIIDTFHGGLYKAF